MRAATAEAHDRVDAAFGDFDLTDRESYARFLAAHADVVWALEAALPGERVTADWEDRKRGALLREDLAQLPKVGQAHPASPPVFDSDAAIAGTLYVLEGSRLGGKFLARSLPTGFPRAYLDSDQRAEKWQQLLAAIDDSLRDPAALEAARTAALATFAAFEHSAENWRKVQIGDGR
ncbi:biliverdin-producing heme oxygenase [Sphingomonas sp. R-74633]|nr:biliverdin-producing heme oxygenase [Sphingomonas sp. R-74633]